MTTLREAAQQALEALKSCSGVPHWPALQPTIHALSTALAQQAEPVEPVAGAVLNEEGRAALVEHGTEDWHCVHRNARRLYTAPPQRKPLTDEDIERIFMTYQSPRQAARAVERAHNITDPQIEDRLARHGIPMPGDPK